MNLLCQVLQTAQVLGALGLLFLNLLLLVDRLAVWTVLDLSLRLLGLLCSLLGLLGVVVFLKVFLSHFALDDHQTRVNERFLEQLALEHPHQVFDSNVLATRTLDDSAVGLNLLLSCKCCLGVCLALFDQGLLVFVQQLG